MAQRVLATPAWAALVLIAGAIGCAAPLPPPEEEGSGTSTGGDGGTLVPALDLDAGDHADAQSCEHAKTGYCEPVEAVSCYEGPSGTEGVGSCAAGKRHCNKWGSAFGPCQDQVLPRPDSCANPTQWICDDEPSGCGVLETGEVLASKGALHSVQRLASDGAGGVIRSYTVLSNNMGTLVVERLLDGQTIWSNAYEFGADFYMFVNVVRSIAVDGEGATIVALDVQDAMMLEGNLIQGPAAVLLKLDASGGVEWFRTFAFESPMYSVEAVAIGPRDNIWIGGMFGGTLDFGVGPIDAANYDGFLVRLDANGNTVWSRSLGSPSDGSVYAIAVNADGASYVGGTDGEEPVSCNHVSAVLASYDAYGVQRWKKTFWSEMAGSTVASIALDPNGFVYASGLIDAYMGNSLDLGGEPLDGRMFVAKFGTDGAHIWDRPVLDVPHGGGYVALDPAGHLVWADQDDYSVRIRTYDPDGQFLWQRLIPVQAPPPIQQGDATIILGWGLVGFAMLSDGRFAIGGSFAGTIDLGDGPVTGVTGWDGYFAVYYP